MLDLSRLNREQREAVTAPDGPTLVVAGPGSGKTAVIAARIAYLLDTGRAAPAQVLAVTFTNRAGRELTRRLAAVLGEETADDVFAGTFHAFALGLLRRHADRFGLDPDHLSVYGDDDDRLTALRAALVAMGRDPKVESAEPLLEAIGRAKERLLDPDDVGERDPEIAAVYRAYQHTLRERNALDFDDFLVFAVRLIEAAPALAGGYRHILVDEFQDVNYAQHRLLQLLAAPHGNLFAVGDPLQNLFSWRGSDIRYLLDFARDYPDARVVSLQRNYRSTRAVLDIANALSAVLRYGRRTLWTANPPGVPVVLRAARDARDEATFIVGEVRRLLNEGAIRSPADCAVLYRTNLQARDLELACIQQGMPYGVRGSGDFLARREVRDLLAYLRLLHNPHDVGALGRIVNVPARGLAVVDRRIRTGDELSLARLRAEFPCGLDGRRAGALTSFLCLMDGLQAVADSRPPALLVDEVLAQSGYRRWLEGRDDGEARLANLSAFRELAMHWEAGELASFLDELSLATDLDAQADAQGLALSTVHAAKGLEWPVVFLAGLEEGLLPHAHALDADRGGEAAIEEELRLCYVAVTRAIDRLYLTYARRRSVRGRAVETRPSRFLEPISSRRAA